ncbi:PH domain-containing protein [Staphylococcus americanisciuri]|uniref:PH domain-containing protein n=1 Tax=Staphylococcus americanisciuri TaxID=2973940 RepID=A0ABT2F3L5_9STAP|nr:PH domain-containing protein [Staphylococcus americanisciuri]MCS4487059.1 PH domain-containing protein [Staphylococcus americanisciuri]
MYSPQKLHHISYVMSIFSAIKSNIIPIILFILFTMKDFDFKDPSNYVFPGLVVLFFMITFINDVIKTYRTRYWIEGRHFIVTSGLLNLERKELNISRIQSMDTSQNLIHQIVGGVRLQIQTPSDGIVLETITQAQSDWIQAELEKVKADLNAIEDEANDNQGIPEASKGTTIKQEKLLYHLSKKNLLFMAMTSGAIFVALATLSPILITVLDYVNWDWVYDELSFLVNKAFLVTLIIISIIVLLSYLFGIIITIVRYYNYTLKRQGDYLTIRYGLLNVKKVTVPLKRIQAVIETKSFLRTLFGFTSYDFIITSDMEIDLDNDFADGRVMVLPFIRHREAQHLLKSLVPHMSFHKVQPDLPWRGFHRRFWIESVILIIIASVVQYFYWPWLWIPAGVLMIYMIIRSYLQIIKAGWSVIDDEISIRNVTLFGFKTTYFKRDRILGFQRRTHPIMARAQLSHFYYTLAQGALYMNVGLEFVDVNDVEALQVWYTEGAEHDD